MMPKETSVATSANSRSIIVTATAAAVLLVVTCAALWINNTFYNTESFSRIATTSFTSESSRQAVARAVTDEALEDRPAVKNLVDDTVVKLIAGALDTERFRSVLNRLVGRLQTTLTSKRPASIVINLEGIRDLLGRLVAVIEQERDVRFDPSKIPSQIVLFDKERLPNFYGLGVAALWVGPLALLGALGLLAYPYIKRRTFKVRRIIGLQGAALIGIGLLALLFEPLFRPIVLSGIASPDVRTVVDNLYSAFMQPFNGYIYLLLVVGFLAVIGSVVMPKIGVARFSTSLPNPFGAADNDRTRKQRAGKPTV